MSAGTIAPARAALPGLLALLALMCAAPSASGVIVHLHGRKALSFQGLRGSATRAQFDAALSNLDYSGGPVMPSNTNYAVYWRPSGAPAYPADYRAGVDTYFEDLAHDSDGQQNTDSVSSQYNDWEGDHARYASHFGGDLLDTDPYPANGCKQAAICLTDEQLEQELAKLIEARKLPTDLQHEYFLLTPPAVEDCFEAGGSECSVGTKRPTYCAYHGAFSLASGVVVYSNDPYVTGNPGCDDGNHPSGKTSDGVIEGGLSHEHNESVTDPEPASGWTDLVSGEEIGDKCRTFEPSVEFGTPLGQVEVGGRRYKYNQVINGHYYWYQQEWSDEGKRCLQRWSSGGAPATASLSSEAGGASNEMKFDAAASTAPGGVAEYDWKFGGTSTPTETATPTVSHKFPGAGKWEVALTVYASNGESAGTTRLIETGDEGPTAAFSVAPRAPTIGQSVSFGASESEDPDGSITAYEWNFGDGSPAASGTAPTHAYEAAGAYTVTLRVSDGSGQIATATHVVEVGGRPTAQFAFGPNAAAAGSPIAFDAAASSDEGASIVSYSWAFGDRSPAGAGIMAEHAFGAAGAYPVTLTVTDSTGRSASATQTVTVLEGSAAGAALSGYSAGSGGASATGANASGSTASAGFSASASLNPTSGLITIHASASAAGTLRWLATFANGRFGVFAARASRCRSGFVALRARCRPLAVLFSKGSDPVRAPGSVTLLLKPTRSARRAIAGARRQRRGLRVSVAVTFQPAGGGPAVSHTFSIVVRGPRGR